MSAAASPARSATDIGEVLDAGHWTSLQKTVVALAALSIVMDGFDGQLIGFAVPVLIKEWGVARGDFAPALAAGLVGMGIGSACAGLFADRFGRRWAVIGSVLVFGLATCAISLAGNLWEIGILRFVAGLSEADTASTLGVPVGTVKSRAARALVHARELLDVEERARG